MNLKQLLFLNAAGVGGTIVEETVTGNPVKFETNKAKPLTKLLCAWTPTQSGTGDPAPDNVRPITGMDGVRVWQYPQNVLNINRSSSQTSNDIIFTPVKDANNKTIAVHVKGTATKTNTFFTLNYVNATTLSVPSGSYKCYGGNSRISIQGYIINANGNEQNVFDNKTDDVSEFTIPSDAKASWIRLRVNVQTPVDETIYPIIVNTDETIAAYAVEFPALGKNLLTGTPYVGQFFNIGAGVDLKKTSTHASFTESGNEITVTTDVTWYGCIFATGLLSPGTYNVHTETSDESCRLSIYVTDADLITKGRKAVTSNNINVTLTESSRIAVTINNQTTGSVVATNVQVESGSSFTSWEPYTNTVYGGTLDLTTGVLTATWVGVDAKSLQWQDSSQVERQVYSTNLSASGYSSRGLDDDTNIICDSYKTISAKTSISTMDDNGIKGNTTYGNTIYIRDTRYETRQDFKNNVDAFFAYELAEPINYQLTPTQVTALLGNNTIWSDANGDCEVKYLKKG